MIFSAESESEIETRLKRFEEIVHGEESARVGIVEPPADPRSEANVVNATLAYFWQQVVGQSVEKLSLRSDGQYE